MLSTAGYVASAATAAFPPSAAILTALTLVLTASSDVSKSYDKIMAFFEELNSFLERIQMLEDKLPQMDGYQHQLMRVIAAILKVCGVARRAVEEGRLKRFGKTILRGGEDPALSEATGSLETAMKRLESATGTATLAGVQDIKESTKRLEGRGEDIHHLVVGITANQQKSETEMREQFQVMAARFDKIYEMQSRSANSSSLGSESQIVEPGLRKQVAFNIVNAFFPTKNSPISHIREIQHTIVDGTGRWLQEKQGWLGWKEGTAHENILWLTGPAGSGKSCTAYLACVDLKLSTTSDLNTSVAGIYLKDFSEDQNPVQGMICSIINQIAARNVGYCERVAASLYRTYPGLEWEADDTVQNLLQQHIVTQFGANSDFRLFLILDGADESALDDEMIIKLLKQVVAEKLRIRVLITSRPSWGFPKDDLEGSFTQIELGKEDIKHDMHNLVAARIASSPRLHRCRKRTKKFITSQILAKADTLLSAEHMLLMLSNIHQEDMIVKQLTNIPGTLHGLFKHLESAIVKNRRPQQMKALQTLFAWLAFANRPLTVAEANGLLRMHLDNQFFSFEEELSGASGQILEFASTGEDEVNEYGSESEIPEQSPEPDGSDDETNPQSLSNFMNDSETSILRFRNRSLRDFFTSAGGKADELRSTQSVSHAAILEISINLLCGVGGKSPDEHRHGIGEALMSYATLNWAHHFQRIDMNNLNNDQIVTVLRSVKHLLTNKNNVVSTIVRYCGHYETVYRSMQWGTSIYEPVLDLLPIWLQKGIELGEGLLGDDFNWIKESSTNPDLIMVDSLHGYTRLWLQRAEREDFVVTYGLGLLAYFFVS